MQTDYDLPMFARLVPSTSWNGGRMAETDILTLEDAAEFATSHASTKVVVADFLRAAARGEIPLRAIVSTSVEMLPCRSGEKPQTIPSGSIPTLPLSACTSLAVSGTAAWRHIDGHEPVDALDGTLGRFKRWVLSGEAPAIATSLNECRVLGYDVHALADAFRNLPSEPQVAARVFADERQTVSADETACAMAEYVSNGEAISWNYWVARKSLSATDAAKLLYCIDPVRWSGDHYSQGEIPVDLRETLTKCIALLSEIRPTWSLRALVENVGIGGVPFNMRRAVALASQQSAKFSAGRYTLAEAAAYVARIASEREEAALESLVESALSGQLPMYAPGELLPSIVRDRAAIRAFYEEVYWDDLNQWMSRRAPRLRCAFPPPMNGADDPDVGEARAQRAEPHRVLLAISRAEDARRSDPLYVAKYRRAWQLYDELDKWQNMQHGGDPLREVEIEKRLRSINDQLTDLLEPTMASTPANKGDMAATNRRAIDTTRERGARRRILEQWDAIEREYGANIDGVVVWRVLKRDKDEKLATLKTVQNHLSQLRRDGLIP